MRVFRILAIALFIVSVPTALLTTTIRYVANEARVYRYAIDQFGGVEATGISRSELLRASDELRAYFGNDAETLDIRVERAGRQVSLFNARETAHLADVKSRFATMNRVQELSLLYAIAFVAVVVLWAREITLRAFAVCVAAGSFIAMLLVGIAGALGMAGFDSAWEGFHRLIFSNDFWLLNPLSDRLIQMFPPDFWQSIVFFIGLMVAAEAALLLLAAGIYLGVTKDREPQQRLTPYYA